jgi:Fe-S-cluster containining protein
MKTGIFSNVDEELVQEEKEIVISLIREGRTPQQAVKIAVKALAWADQIIIDVEAEPPLPRAIVCQAGCHFCCFNQVEVTPVEVLAIGDYVERRFSPAAKAALIRELERAISLKSGKTKVQIARLRRELRCPFLREGCCAVYEVRPLVCRAIHSLDAAQCQRAFRSSQHTGVEHYSHRNEIVGSILKGLLEGCREMGCQAEPLDLAQALRDFFEATSPIEQWIEGKRTFSPLVYAEE